MSPTVHRLRKPDDNRFYLVLCLVRASNVGYVLDSMNAWQPQAADDGFGQDDTRLGASSEKTSLQVQGQRTSGKRERNNQKITIPALLSSSSPGADNVTLGHAH